MYKAIASWQSGWLLFYVTLAVVAALPAVYELGSRYEGRFLPVVRDVELVSIEPHRGGSLITLNFNKVRDCSPLQLSWYHFTGATNSPPMEEPRRFIRVSVRSAGNEIGPIDDRPLGEQTSNTWWVALTPEALLTNSFSDLTHNCHPLWPVTTRFYP